MKLYPKIVTGTLNAHNKDACDWGWQGYLAYGCQNLVTVIEPKSVQVIQVLDKHKGVVTQVKWAHEQYHHDLNSPYTLRLASSDTHGHIVVWDVGLGVVRSEFIDGNKPVLGMQWLSNQDACRDLLVCLHPPYSLILWNADTGTKLWKKSYTETLLSFTFDPFNSRNLAFLGQDCIIFISDFTINKTPSSNGKKFYISNPSQVSSMSRSSSSNSLERKTSTSSASSSKNLAKRMSRILVGESKPKTSPDEEAVTLNECLQLCFHRSCRHHLMLLYPREMLILDLEINQTVGIIAIDRSSSSFTQVIPCWQRDVLMCLHENGSVSVRVRRRNNSVATPAPEGHGAFDDTPTQLSMEVAYDLRCQSDPLRVTRHNKLYGASLCPVSEKAVALIMSDSRILLWELTSSQSNVSDHGAMSPLLSPGWDVKAPTPSVSTAFPVTSDMAHPQFALADTIATSQTVDTSATPFGHSVQLKFLLNGLLSGIAAHVTVLRMCPPLTNKNIDIYQPLMALGTHSGTVQIVNASSGQVDREYSLHSSPVRGIEWSGLKTFISYAYPNPGPTNLVKNELFLLDITSGKQEQLRTNREVESPIEMLAISHLKQYFVLLFKDKPLELWDLRSQAIIRELPRQFPRPTTVVWSPSHSLKTLRKKLLDYGDEEKPSSLSSSTHGPSMSTSGETLEDKDKKQVKSNVREHFVMTDKEGTVFHFIVEGTAISDVTKIPPESGLAKITALAWKGDILIFGDSEGFQCLWDLKARISRTTPTNRGWIKKIKYAPGRDNMKFFTLHNDGVIIWDIGFEGKCTMQYSIKSPKDISKVVDIDWAGSDRPALVTTHSTLHICDITMKSATSGTEHWDLPEPMFCPHILPARLSQIIKSLLQHQTWREQYTLSVAGLLEHDKPVQKRISAQLQLIDKELTEYLPVCRFGTAHRCLLIARLYGDESEVHFWNVALHYLRSLRGHGLMKPEGVDAPGGQGSGEVFTSSESPTQDLVVLDEEREAQRKEARVFCDHPLERCYDSLCDNQSFKRYQLDRVHLQDSKRATTEHTQKCADSYVQLGQTDRAVQLLLETESEADTYYIDCLKACLVASVRSSGASQSTIKLVATNLIASGRLIEGVQLLCLINKGLDACRYLQTYGAWDHAVWLAKASLEAGECAEVMKRWSEYLNSPQVNQKSKSVLVLLSLGQFYKVLEVLYSMRNFDRAALFLEACLEFGLLRSTEQTSSLFEAIYLEYARYLINLGLSQAAEHYCRLAGEKGQQLLKEVEILFSPT
ncbi:WD repeat-containing protein 11 [Aplysia californica]|uniref:WD repeat-containing protein 11 n=1 Tax=Aplysia californica TaxID=6500 RepID=A0ABM0JAS5_APLCA|nr:WD repeat-containing protein 11 [Aplysia californica]